MANEDDTAAEARLLPVNELLLDRQNPRLPEDLEPESQEELIEFVAEEYDALRIAESMARFKYFRSEPLIVVEEEGQHVVVEGNRRLAALKILLDDELREALPLSRAERWRAAADQADREALGEVPVEVRADRADIAPLLGYRHISGIEPWDPWPKARFIATLIEEGDRSFEDAASIVGEDDSSVKSHYRNFRILRQASENFELPTDRAEDRFGTFNRAMQSTDLREFIGAPAPRHTERDVPPPSGGQCRRT